MALASSHEATGRLPTTHPLALERASGISAGAASPTGTVCGRGREAAALPRALSLPVSSRAPVALAMARTPGPGGPAQDPGRVFPSQMTLGGTDLADGGIGGRSPATEGLFDARGGGFRQRKCPP